MEESRVYDFQIWQSKRDGQWYWNLRARNYQSVAIGGEGFSTEEACRNSIEIVKTCGGAPVQLIEDPNS